MNNNSDYLAFCKHTYTRTWNEAYLIEGQKKIRRRQNWQPREKPLM